MNEQDEQEPKSKHGKISIFKVQFDRRYGRFVFPDR